MFCPRTDRQPIGLFAAYALVVCLQISFAAVLPETPGFKMLPGGSESEPKVFICEDDTFSSRNTTFPGTEQMATELLKKARGSARAALPTRYLKVGVVVEYNIYDKHHGGDLQKTLQKVKDLFHGVVQDFKELNIIVSLAGVIIWTSSNLFEVNTNNLFDQADYSYQMQNRFSHDHMIRLRSGTFESVNTNGIAGLAYRDTMCSYYSVSWATVWSPSFNFNQEVAIISHEIGHSLGFQHDGPECLCGETAPREFCRMGGSYVQNGPLVWSTCNRATFEATASKYTCLNNKPWNIFRIRSEMNGKRLDVYSSNTSPGASVVMWDPNSSTAQQWYIAGDMTIRSVLNDFCLTSKGYYPALVTMEPCDANRINKWVYNWWTREIQIATNSARCLSIPNNDNGIGARVTELNCNSQSNQKWRIVRDDNVDSPSYIYYGGVYLSMVNNY